MAKDDNLKDFLVDLADTIREKKGISGPINPQDFASEIASIESGGGNGWTGHADAEGLRAIGWTDEDIAYYQENGVDWDEEDDHLHLISDDNKALYGVLTADNISTYKDRIVYLPKIDTSSIYSFSQMFRDYYRLVAVPRLKTSQGVNFNQMFYNCQSLKCIYPMSIRDASTASYLFYRCRTIRKIELTETGKLKKMGSIFSNCHSLTTVKGFDEGMAVDEAQAAYYLCHSLTSIPLVDYSECTSMANLFYSCTTLCEVNADVSSASNLTGIFTGCYSLVNLWLRNLNATISLTDINGISKESLCYAINNEAATSPITITLAANVYDKYANEPEVLEALSNHPKVTLAK